MSAYLAAFQDHSRVLSPGEKGLLPIIASDRGQARIVLDYTRDIFLASPILSQMLEKDDLTWELPLKNRAIIRVMTCSRAAVRGYTLLGAVCEEVAHWQNEGSNPDVEIYRGLKPGRLTTRGPLITITTVNRKRGVPWEVYKQYFGKDDPRILVWVAGSEIMNPCLDPVEIEAERQVDPEAAAAEFDCIFRSDLVEFLPYETIEALVIPGRRELPPRAGVQYFGFADPASGVPGGDSFSLGLAHRAGERTILDVLRRWQPPFNPMEVVRESCELLKDYGLGVVTGDGYAAEITVSLFRQNGITYKRSELDRSRIFLESLPLFSRGQLEILDDRVLLAELRGLERRVRAAGRDLITHNPGQHDDAANAAVGAMLLAADGRKRIAGPLFSRHR